MIVKRIIQHWFDKHFGILESKKEKKNHLKTDFSIIFFLFKLVEKKVID